MSNECLLVRYKYKATRLCRKKKHFLPFKKKPFPMSSLKLL